MNNMNNYIRLTFLAFILLFASSISAQDAEFVYEDRVYDDLIRSVQIYINNQPALVPIIGLNNGFRSLTLRFDEMSEDANEFFYRVVHCDRNWKASDLDEIEYIEGFNGEEIQNYQFSTNTYVDYVNFSLTLPNEDTQFRISGNYILIIYDDEALTNPVITRRFMIDENQVQLFTDFQRVNDVTKSNSHQQLDVEVDLGKMRIGDPMNELTLSIVQNNRWDNMISNSRPKFISRSQVNFDNTGKLAMAGGKEFRQFDIRSLQYTTAYVSEIDLHHQGTNVLLHTEKPRAYRVYRDEVDFDGRYVIQNFDFQSSSGQLNYQSNESNFNADYADVSFALEMNQSLEEVYVVGAFTDWRLEETYRMQYSNQHNGYHVTIPMKQGVYNYLFATRGADGKPNYDDLEGDSEKTVNYYTTILYYRDFTQQYDRIIDTQQIVATGEY
jgi:hypothetical protein